MFSDAASLTSLPEVMPSDTVAALFVIVKAELLDSTRWPLPSSVAVTAPEVAVLMAASMLLSDSLAVTEAVKVELPEVSTTVPAAAGLVSTGLTVRCCWW